MTKEQWEAIKNHDLSYDGKFYYGMKTSRTICKPSCSARNPHPENIVIFPKLEDGLQAGYHPCTRCRPDLPEWHGARQELVSRAEKYIHSHFSDKFSLDQIAEALFVNKIYLSKCFKDITGSTLLRYHNGIRCQEACRLLRETDLPVEIVSDKVGFATSSHFARVFREFNRCSPTEYRRNYLKSLK